MFKVVTLERMSNDRVLANAYATQSGNPTGAEEASSVKTTSIDDTGSHTHAHPWARSLAAGLAMVGADPAPPRPRDGPRATGTPGCTGSGLGILLFTDATDVHIGDAIDYSITVLNGTGSGPVVCDASDIKAFVVTPDGVSHSVALVRTRLRSGESDYYTNVVSYVVRTQDIQPDGTVRTTAVDTGIIRQNDTPSQGGANQGVNTEIKQPCIRITAVCVGGVGENGLITFTGTVLNCGNVALTGIRVTNTVNGGQVQVAAVLRLARARAHRSAAAGFRRIPARRAPPPWWRRRSTKCSTPAP